MAHGFHWAEQMKNISIITDASTARCSWPGHFPALWTPTVCPLHPAIIKVTTWIQNTRRRTGHNWSNLTTTTTTTTLYWAKSLFWAYSALQYNTLGVAKQPGETMVWIHEILKIGRGVWGRTGTCMRMAESFRYSSEIITILLIGYTPIQNKVLKKN